MLLEHILPRPIQSGPKCFYLVGSLECPQQNGYNILVTQDYNDTKQFDTYIRSRRATTPTFIQQFKQDYQCPEFQKGLQYHTSILCAMLTEHSIQCTSPSLLEYISLCQETCRQGLIALENVFKSQCSATTNTNRTLILNHISSFCDRLPLSTNGTCLDGSRQPFEQNQCGFETILEGVEYCSRMNNTLPCCFSLKASGTDTENVPPSGAQLHPILFYSLIVIAILLCILVIVLLYKWSSSRKTLKEPNLFLCVKVVTGYDAKMEDELSLTKGDRIKMYETFEDGWGYGKLLRTGEEGTFPLICTLVGS